MLVSYRDRKTLEGGCGSLSVEVRVALTSPSYTSTPLTPLGSHYGQLAGYKKKKKKRCPSAYELKRGTKWMRACVCLHVCERASRRSKANVRKGAECVTDCHY